jgi:TetR/AcrR family transcriptional regulator, cholesterol catabolism regulator
VVEQVEGEKRWQAGRRRKIAHIRDIAIMQFCKHGYASSSLQDIAKLAEMHKATLYHYFESKEYLLAHILDFAHDQISEIIETVQALDGCAVKRLRKLLELQLCWYLDNVELARVTFHEWTNVGDDLIEAQTERRRVYDNFLRSLIREVQDEGYFKGQNVSLAANYIIGAMNAAPAWYAKDGSLHPEEVASLYADMSLRTLGITECDPVEDGVVQRLQQAGQPAHSL